MCTILYETDSSETEISVDDSDDLPEIEKVDSEDDPETHGVGLLQTIFNDIKNIVGEVMFSLSHALAIGTGIVPGIILTVALSLLLGYTSSMLGRAGAATTGECNFAGICNWAKGPAFAKFVVTVVALKTTITCVAFSIITKEAFTAVFLSFGATGFFAEEVKVLLFFAIIVVLPLILMKDLSFLSYFSLLGIGGELLALGVILLRSLDGTYQEGGRFFADLPPEKRPDFEHGVNWWGVSLNTIILVANLALSFNGGHYNAPKYFNLLHKKSVQRWNLVTAAAFSVVVFMYLVAMTAGYLTFGKNVQGFLLLNYAAEDRLATVARIGVGTGVLLALPLAFTACRDNYMQVMKFPKTRQYFFGTTFTLFTSIITLACLVESIAVVNSIGGAIFGSLITLVIPGLIAVFAGEKLLGSREQRFQWAVLSLGVLILCFGTYQAILKSMRH